MMVAIPAMSKVIENSRKDTFIETAQTYTNAVNTLWKADSLYCGSENKAPSTMKAGSYYVLIDSTNTELVERGGKSSWGNKDVKGYVKVEVSFDSNGNRKEEYSVALTDDVHGIKELEKDTNSLTRSDVSLKLTKEDLDLIKKDKSKVTTCSTVDGEGTTFKAAKMVSGNISSPQVGDMFSIGTERFHVISSTADTITGFAEYNLYVGGDDYGGWKSSGKPYKGTTVFSDTSSVYSGSKVEQYINEYNLILKEMGAKINETRLLRKEELEKLGCNSDTCTSSKYKWIYSTSYWIMTTSSSYVCNVFNDGRFYKYNYYFDNFNGVRPVVTISKSEF